MNNDVSNLKKMTSNEIYDYLYKTGLSNIFDDYKKQRELLSANARKNIEDMNALNEIQKRYLGEYASNIGLGDVSDSLQSLANDYVKNLTGIKQDEANQQISLESAYKTAQQEAYNTYAGNMLQQKLSQEEQDAQLAQQMLEEGLSSGFYGYGEDGQKLSLQEFLDKPEYANLSDAFKKYLTDKEQYVNEMNGLASYTIDEFDGVSKFDKTAVADYIKEKFSTNKADKVLSGKKVSIDEGTIDSSSVGIKDAMGNYYVSVKETVNEYNKNKNEKYHIASQADLTTQYGEENNGAIPQTGNVMLYTKDGYTNKYYFDGKDWHLMVQVASNYQKKTKNGYSGNGYNTEFKNGSSTNNNVSVNIGDVSGELELGAKANDYNFTRNLDLTDLKSLKEGEVGIKESDGKIMFFIKDFYGDLRLLEGVGKQTLTKNSNLFKELLKANGYAVEDSKTYKDWKFMNYNGRLYQWVQNIDGSGFFKDAGEAR